MSALPPQVKERPILFIAPMVLALLAGTKTQTRRIAKFEQYEPGRAFNFGFSGLEAGFYHSGLESSGWVLRSRGAGGCWNDRTKPLHSPYGKAGDRLWVRETWRTVAILNHLPPRDLARGQLVQHVAEEPDRVGFWGKTRTAIHMPRWVSRITLDVTGVRIERLQAISREDAIAEGIERHEDDGVTYYGQLNHGHADPRTAYSWLWESINGEGSWKANPWVWVLNFKRVTP